MLWSFEKDTILTPLSKSLALQKHMSITGLMRRLLLIGIDAIWQLDALYIGSLIDFNRLGQLRIANTTTMAILKKRLNVS